MICLRGTDPQHHRTTHTGFVGVLTPTPHHHRRRLCLQGSGLLVVRRDTRSIDITHTEHTEHAPRQLGATGAKRAKDGMGQGLTIDTDGMVQVPSIGTDNMLRRSIYLTHTGTRQIHHEWSQSTDLLVVVRRSLLAAAVW